jgi:4-diphosphocytidyl-2-C-methyl-D-erythritol kinase
VEIIALARAKINLAIDVLTRQANGYHQVAMVLQSISLADRLTFHEKRQGIILTCTDPHLTCGEGNLVYRAARLLSGMKGTGGSRGVHIHIEKNIPMEAGLGGGSSDAAATLLALNQLWELRLSRDSLLELCFKLGADVPFCLIGGTALARGLGERITPLPPLPPLPLVLVKPSFGLSTALVYRSLSLEHIKKRPDLASLIKALQEQNTEGIFPPTANVREEGVGDSWTVIAALKEDLQSAGARGVLMSGSGTTVFGFFGDEQKARETVESFRSRGLWSKVVTTSSPGIDVQVL